MAVCFHSWCGKARNNISQWEISALQSVHCFFGLIWLAKGWGAAEFLYTVDRKYLWLFLVESFHFLLSILGWISWGGKKKINQHLNSNHPLLMLVIAHLMPLDTLIKLERKFFLARGQENSSKICARSSLGICLPNSQCSEQLVTFRITASDSLRVC